MDYMQRVDGRIVPEPPRLHWGVVFVLQIVTLSLFGAVWLFVQSLWAKKMTGQSKVMRIALVHMCLIPGFWMFTFVLAIAMGATGHTSEVQPLTRMLTTPVQLLVTGFYLATAFTLRAQLEGWPIQTPLGAAMTFFFAPVYFQYHLYDYRVPDAAEVYGPVPPSPDYVSPTSLNATR